MDGDRERRRRWWWRRWWRRRLQSSDVNLGGTEYEKSHL
jgi:hypothetical protein